MFTLKTDFITHMDFKKYQHLERYGTTAVQGINEGSVYIFPKLDGTNASLWWDASEGLCAGSRNRKLSLDNDNAGFYNWAIKQEVYINFFTDFPDAILYGEWLVPHTLKTYDESAWRHFYVFDVCQGGKYVDYDMYSDELAERDIDYIPALAHYWNPDIDKILSFLDENTYLVKQGVGEGIVVKNYDFKNKFGDTIWAKIVTAEFKADHGKAFPVTEKPITEQSIVDQYVTKSLIDKTYAKIENDNAIFTRKQIPQLIETVFYELITEETWNFVKKYKNPTIDFNLLKRLTTEKIKTTLPYLFGK